MTVHAFTAAKRPPCLTDEEIVQLLADCGWPGMTVVDIVQILAAHPLFRPHQMQMDSLDVWMPRVREIWSEGAP